MKTMGTPEQIAVVGAGMMGHGIAQVFAAAGHDVFLTDVSEEILNQALDHARANLTLLADKGIGKHGEIEPAMARIRTTTDMKKAVSDARFIVEAVSEKLDLKQRIFEEIEQYCSPETVIATNTSVISVSEIAARTKAKGRVVGTHFWFPPFLIPLVEVVKGNETAPEVVETTYDLMKRIGKHPIRCLKDVPGFVANRLQHALWREAISIVEHGIADAATVDEAIKHSFGIRLPVLAPLENADMAGLDLTLQIHNYILKHIESSTEPSPALKARVEAGNLGFKTGHGFHEWTPEQIARCRERLLDHLIEWRKEHGED